MNSMVMNTLTNVFVRSRVTNSTDANFPTIAPTTTEPTGIGDAVAQTTKGVFNLYSHADNTGAGVSQNLVCIVPFGTGSDTNTFLMRVIGWRLACDRPATGNPRDSLNTVWIPVNLAAFTCTLSTPVGVAGRSVIATERFCDTIALTGTQGNDDISIDIVSPANDTIGHVVVDMKGSQKLELIFDRNSSATACNALVAMY